MNNRWKEILNILYEFANSTHYISGIEIAEKLGVSDRTIRNDINQLNDFLSEKGAYIHSKRGQGYSLEVNSLADYQNFVEKTFKEVAHFDQSDREQYILNQLLFTQNEVTIDSLMSMFFVSDASIQKDLSKLALRLKEFNLKLSNSQRSGIKVIGEEIDKRKFVIENYTKSPDNHLNVTPNLLVDLASDVPVVDILIIILKVLSETGTKYSDFTINNLLAHIVLSVKRIKMGKFLPKVENTAKNFSEEIRKISLSILERLEIDLGIKLPESEIEYISIHLSKNQQLTSLSESSWLEEIKSIINALEEELELSLHLDDDQEFISGLMKHLELTINRLDRNSKMVNPLLEQIQQEYPGMIDLVQKHFQNISFFKNREISLDEYGYISIHILAAIERLRVEKKVNILVVCGSGQASSKLLKNRIESEYGHRINVQETIGYFELGNKDLSDIDFILTTVDLSNLILPIPVLEVDIFITDQDKQKIEDLLNQLELKIPITDALEVQEFSTADEYLMNQLKSDLFRFFETNISRHDMIEQLVDMIYQSESSKIKKTLSSQIKYRESLGSTAFSDKVAIPHPFYPVTSKTYLVVAILKEALTWDEDHSNIQMVVLLSPAKGDQHLQFITESLAKIVLNEDLVNKLITTDSFDNFTHVLASYYKF